MLTYQLPKVYTYHISQEPRVLWAILREENRSRKSPSFSSLGSSSASSGISLPFSRATLLKIVLASDSRPFFNSQRTDSGMKLQKHLTRFCPRSKFASSSQPYNNGAVETTQPLLSSYFRSMFPCIF